MALGIGLPVVFKAHQPALVIARPGHELEGPVPMGWSAAVSKASGAIRWVG